MSPHHRIEYAVNDNDGEKVGTAVFAVCDGCGCLIGARHTCFAEAVEHIAATDFNEVAVEAPWRPPPLSLALTTRDDVTFHFDGRKNDTRADLSSLDAVDKAALTVLLQEALTQLREQPRLTIPLPGGVQPAQPWNPGIVSYGTGQ
jgi:hypothetical protein